MPYAIRYREELPEPVQRELDDMIAYFNHQLDIAINPDGSLKSSALVPPVGANITDESHWWRKGPWSFDDPDAADPNVAAILTPDIAGPISVNDFAPKGIDSCIICQLSPITGTLTLNGILSPNPRRRRIMLLYNVSTTQDVVLANAAAGSQPTNRFNLPNGNVTLAPGQIMWIYWSIAGWNAAVTAQKSGGLFGEGSTSLPSTFTTGIIGAGGGSNVNTTYTIGGSLGTSAIDTLNAGAISVLPAPGSLKIYVPVHLTLRMHRSAQWTNSGTAFIIRYTTGGLTAISIPTTLMSAAGAINDGFNIVSPTGTTNFSTTAAPSVNNAMEIFCTSDANPGAQTGSWDWSFAYYILSLTN